MSEQETSPSAVDPTSPEGVNPSSGETVTETPEVESPPAAEESAEPSMEQLQKDATEAARKIQEQGQELADLRNTYAQTAAQRDQYHQAALNALGHVQATQDPVEAARQKWAEADTGYDREAATVARLEYDRTLQADTLQKAQQQAVQTAQMQASFPQAQKMLGVTDQNAAAQRLRDIHSSLTFEELALIDLDRRGKLNETLAARQEARETEAAKAEALRSLVQPGGRAVLGSLEQTQQTETVESWNFDMWNKETRAAYIEGGGVVVDPSGEVIESPLG